MRIAKSKSGFFEDRDAIELPPITTNENDPLGPVYRTFITCEGLTKGNMRVKLEEYMKDGHISSVSAIFIPRAKNGRIDWDKITLTKTTENDNSSRTTTYQKDLDNPDMVRDEIKELGKEPDIATRKDLLGRYIFQVKFAASEMEQALSLLEP